MTADWKQCLYDFEQQIIVGRMETIRTLVNKFGFDGYRWRKRQQFEMTQQVLNTFKSDLYQKVSRYDMFRELRVDFDENLISDVIATLLQPKKSPFRKELLVGLLEHNKKVEIADIIKETDLGKIFCRREVSGMRSRIDIRIETRNEDQANAIIDLELKGKNPNAGETYCDGNPQTVREYKDLEDCKNRHVRSYNGMTCSIAALYITPYGTPPASKNFVRVSYDNVREIVEISIQKALKELEEKAWDSESRDSESQLAVVKAFFNSKWLF